MRICHVAIFLFVLAATGLLTGCKSMSPSRFLSRRTDQELTISQDDAVLAEALASFSTGVLHEGLRESDQALTNYLRAVQLSPDRNELYIRIAAQHIKRGEHDKAIAVMEESCRRIPQSVDTRLHLAQLYQMLNQLDKAEDSCLKAIAIAPQNYRGYVQLASVYLDEQNEDRVLDILNDALGKVDEKLPVLRLLGDLHAQKITTSAGKTATSDLEQAIAYYEQAARRPRDDLSLSYLQRLGDLYILNREFEEAIQCFSTIAARQPNDVQVQKKRALCYIAVNDKKRAIELLKSIFGHEPQKPELQYHLGELYDAMGDITNAISSYTLACDTTPPNRMTYLKLALLYLKTEPEKAVLTLEAGLKRLPEDPKLLEVLAHLYLKDRQYKKAVRIFERLEKIILKEDSSLLKASFFLTFGTAAQLSDLPEKAVSLYKKALDLDSSLLEPYIRLALLYMSQNRSTEAIQLMEKATIVLPDNPSSFYYLGLLNNQAQNFKTAIKAFKKVEELAATSRLHLLGSVFYFNYGAACERNGQLEEAEALLQESILLDPENANAFNYLAYIWAEQGINLEQALDYIGHALDFEPDNGAFIDTLGWIYYKQKKYKKALEYIQTALYFMPDDPTIAEHLGDILATLNQMEDAIAWWKHSFRMNPANKTLEDKLKGHGTNIEELRRDTEKKDQQ